MLDALDPRLLTPIVWKELFEIYQIHYSADLPFLHRLPFLKPLNAAIQYPGSSISTPDASNARPPGSDDFLLAFLALTARFHPRLVAHHSPPTASRPSNPLIASEYYANCANEKQTSLWPEQDSHSNMIDGIQAGLMLGLHDWGMCRGHRAWMRVGMCIRAAQSLGLQYEKDLDDEPNSRSFALDFEAERMGIGQARSESKDAPSNEIDRNIAQEIRRRTFWSCYIMDRYLSSGKYRPQMFFAPSLRTQLPASDRSFAFGERVRTLMLGDQDGHGTTRAEVRNQRQVMLGASNYTESADGVSPYSMNENDNEIDKGKLQVGEEEGLVSRYVKILEIYGKVVHWSCAGGRRYAARTYPWLHCADENSRTESYPPWDPRSEHYKLVHSCLDFKASLPKNDTLTPQNTQSHITVKDSTPYTLVHTVYLLCQIMLHREYVPFIPLRCAKPEGPLDPPLFPPSKYDVPPLFWEKSAQQCFRSARDLMDLVRTCQEWNVLVETPIVGFAIYTVAFVGVYCINFPWMDPDGFMCTRPASAHDGHPVTNAVGESRGFEAARKALEIIGQMRPRLHMADGWFKTINKMHRYLRRMKKDFAKNVQAHESSPESASSPESSRLSLREGGSGGGLDEYKLLERTLKEFGNLDDQDVEMADLHHSNKPLDAVYDDNSNSGATVKSEEGDRLTQPEHPKQEGPWNAINSIAGAGRQTPTSAPVCTGPWRSYEPIIVPSAAHQQPQSAPPAAHPHSQVTSFRPMHQHHDTSVPPAGSGPMPTFASPTPRTASTSSQPSPSYIHQHHSYNNWTPQNVGYGMQPPASAPAGSQHTYAPTSLNPMHSYPTPGWQQAHPMAPPQQLSDAQQIYDPMAKEAWLSTINTALGGDDVAAFVDGGEIEDWALMGSNRVSGQGWLSAVWGEGNGAPPGAPPG